MLARRLPTILPALTIAESLEVTAVHSVAGLLDPTLGAVTRRPFRAPHHSVSTAGLVGGGSTPRPGEVSLAHHGVLFLDELLEFPRAVLEALRQPMEDGFVSIARAAASLRYPARFALVAAMNPCPCGHAGDAARACVCAAADVLRYRARLSGPLADRIDLHVQVPPVSIERLAACAQGERSSNIRDRVEAARGRQRIRYRDDSCNARAPGRWLDAHGGLEVRRARCSAAQRNGCISPRAPFIACFVSRAPSPTSKPARASPTLTWPRHWATVPARRIRWHHVRPSASKWSRQRRRGSFVHADNCDRRSGCHRRNSRRVAGPGSGQRSHRLRAHGLRPPRGRDARGSYRGVAARPHRSGGCDPSRLGARRDQGIRRREPRHAGCPDSAARTLLSSSCRTASSMSSDSRHTSRATRSCPP